MSKQVLNPYRRQEHGPRKNQGKNKNTTQTGESRKIILKNTVKIRYYKLKTE